VREAVTAGLLVVALGSGPASFAAPPAGKKPAPAPKPTGGAGQTIVLGTKQLPGDFGKFGQTYTIGKDAPMNFTLQSAAYTVSPVTIGSQTWVPAADQKLLVLHYTVHNPRPEEQRYYWADITFTAVDARSQNREFVQAVGREDTRDVVNFNLKPGQKLDVFTTIIVPAKGEAPKLIVQREEGAPVIRYDLRSKVAPLKEPYADPADTVGATARGVVSAKSGEFYPLGTAEARLDQVAFTTEPLGGNPPEEAKQFLTAVLTIRNTGSEDWRYYWASFLPELVDADGEKVEYNQTLLKASRDEPADGTLKPGEEARVRLFFTLPANVGAKTLTLRGEGPNVPVESARGFVFDVSGAR
jgi:hypothetical protein